MIATLLIYLLALTDMQVDEFIKILKAFLDAIYSGVSTLWVTLSPLLLAYLAYRQRENRKALDDNTKVNKEALDTANGHNEKIVEAVQLSKDAITLATASPAVQVVHVDNDKDSRIPTTIA